MRRALLTVACVSCGRIDFGELTRTADAPSTDAAPACSAWGSPVMLSGVNGPGQDWEPALSPDRSLLVFANTPATGGDSALYRATRTGPDTFSAPTQLFLEVVSLGSDTGPVWTADGTQLFFDSDRGGAIFQLFVTDVSAGVFGSTSLVAELATLEIVAPAISFDGLELIYGDDFLAPKLHRAVRATTTAPWVVDRALDELNAGPADGWPTLSPDGLTMLFESGRLDASRHSIFATTRPRLDAAWTAPALVTELTGFNGDPDLVSNTELVFSTDRPDGAGEHDLYVTTRTCP